MKPPETTDGLEGCRIYLSEGTPPYTIHAELMRVGSDLVCILTGGTRAHIGAVCLAEPAGAAHPVTGEVRICGAASEGPIVRTLVGEGHKDALPAEMFAKALCVQHGVTVVCTAGIHVDDAFPEEIGIMMENITRLLESLSETEI